MMRKFTFFLLLILTTVYAWADKKDRKSVV